MNSTTVVKIIVLVIGLSLNTFAQRGDTTAIRNDIIRAYDSLKQGNYAYTRATAKRLIPICEEIKSDQFLAGCYRLLGGCFEAEAQKDSALAYYNKSYRLYKNVGNESMAGKLLLSIGVAYYNVGDYDRAINTYFKSLKVYEPIRDTNGMAWAHNNIANIYFFQKAYDDALKHYQKANELFRYKKHKDGLGVTYGNIALIYQEKKDTNSAVEYYKKALEMNRLSHNLDATAVNMCNLASLLFRQRRFNEAEEYYKEALAINLKLNNYYGLSLTYVGMAALAAAKKDYAYAEELLNKSLEANRIAEDKQSEVMTLKNLSDLYSTTGKYKEAYKFLLRHKQLSDSINTGDKLAEVEARYGKEKREKEITLLKQANEINELEIKRKQLTVYASVVVIILVLIIAAFFVRNYLQKKRANDLLQGKNAEILEQKSIIEHKQKEVLDSIQYAKKIQSALIENEEVIQKKFRESFVFFQPKDIVSGDFYWTASVQPTSISERERFYLAVCDSTGHGVPGAFMSLLNSSFLNEAINEKKLHEPNQVLNYVRQRLIDSVSKDGSQDGMDAILLCLEYDQNGEIGKITYSAANNRPLFISNRIARELPADKMPVGKGVSDTSFTLHAIEYTKGDVLYLYTDGYADQFGGEKGKKFKYNNLNKLLEQISDKPFSEQHNILKQTFEKWKGNLEQIDDVCIIGMRI